MNGEELWGGTLGKGIKMGAIIQRIQHILYMGKRRTTCPPVASTGMRLHRMTGGSIWSTDLVNGGCMGAIAGRGGSRHVGLPVSVHAQIAAARQGVLPCTRQSCGDGRGVDKTSWGTVLRH